MLAARRPVSCWRLLARVLARVTRWACRATCSSSLGSSHRPAEQRRPGGRSRRVGQAVADRASQVFLFGQSRSVVKAWPRRSRSSRPRSTSRFHHGLDGVVGGPVAGGLPGRGRRRRAPRPGAHGGHDLALQSPRTSRSPRLPVSSGESKSPVARRPAGGTHTPPVWSRLLALVAVPLRPGPAA